MAPDPWSSFTRDPRRPEFASLRASDADREVVHRVLAEAYADGRLDRDELDTRSTATGTARTLGDLAGLLDGLVPVDEAAYLPDRWSPDRVQQRAVEKWEAERRQAFGAFLVPTLICWVVWSVTMFGGFPWPVFVALGTGVHLLNVVLHKREIIAREVRSIERKQRKELEQRSGGPGERE